MCRPKPVDSHHDEMDEEIALSQSKRRKRRRLMLHTYNRLQWLLGKLMLVFLASTPRKECRTGQSMCKKRVWGRRFLNVILASVSLWYFTVPKAQQVPMRALSWTYKHASCFTSEAATTAWSLPATVPRTCPPVPYSTATMARNSSGVDIPMLSPDRICLVSLTDGAGSAPINNSNYQWAQQLWQRLTRCRNFDAIADMVRWNHAQYAARHGYRYTMYDDITTHILDPSRPPAWSKIRAVQAQFQSGACDWVLWLDADVVVMNPSIRLEETLIDPTADLIVTPDHSFGVSSGVWLMRNSDWSHQLLNEWWNATEFIRARGLSLSGDNAAFGDLVQQKRMSRGEHTIRVTPHRCSLNSNGLFVNSKGVDVGTKRSDWRGSLDFYHTGDFLAHASGIDRKDVAVRYLLDHAATLNSEHH